MEDPKAKISKKTSNENKFRSYPVLRLSTETLEANLKIPK